MINACVHSKANIRRGHRFSKRYVDETNDDDDDHDRDDGDDGCRSRNRLPPPHETQPIIRRGHRFSKIESRASTSTSTSTSTSARRSASATA